MKKYLIFLMIFLVSFAVVAAAAAENETNETDVNEAEPVLVSEEGEKFTFKVNAEKDSIALNEQAEFQVIIHNSLGSIENFIIYITDVEWVMGQEVVKVYPDSTSSRVILVTPTKNVEPGLYGIKLLFKREATGEVVHEELLLINAGGAEDVEYVPSIKMEIDMVEKFNPGEPATATVTLENMNPLNMTDLVLRISSDLPAFNREQAFSLGSLEKVSLESSFDIPEDQQPKEYKVNFDVLQNDEVVESAEAITVEVASVMPAFNSKGVESGVFLKTTREITYTSDANVRNTQTMKYPTNWFARIFTKTAPDAEVITDEGASYYAWNIELGPGESKAVIVTTNYRTLLYIIIVIIIALLLYWKYKSPVLINKSVSSIATEEGGISRLKVMVDVTNRSGKEMKDITILDIVPNIADIEKASIEGTLAPSKVLRHRTKGSILKWEMPELAPGEERLISYTIKSKLSIIGSFRLPKTKIKFFSDGKERIVRSNSLRISA
jgi:hypothetical protein